MAAFFPVLFAAGIFLGVLFGVWMVAGAMGTRRELERAHLARRIGRTPDVRQQRRAAEEAPSGPGMALLQRLIQRAGGTPTINALLVRITAVAGVGAVVAALIGGPLFAVLGLSLGAIPILLVVRQANQRSEALAAQLPDAFDLMARALRAGHAFADVLRTSAKEIRAPLGQELSIVSERHRLGLDLRNCLLDMAERQFGNFDLHLFVSMVLLHQQTGGNLIETLQHLAETIRERAIARDKLRAVTAEVRMSAMIVGVLPFFVSGVLIWVRPTYLLPLLYAPLGQKLLGGALISLGAGFYWMRKLARVEE